MKKKINFFFEKIKFILKLRLYVIFYKFLDFGAPQEGENIILNRIFAKKKKGFYVDIGAHHPIRFSNTLSLYKRGWSGINIEPNAKLINYFKKYRPEDKNLNYAISMRKGTKNYYSFQDPALNTLDEKIKNLRMKQGFKIISKTKVNVDTMVNVLNKYCNYKKKIDLLKIDVEGSELEVLQSNNWKKYSPDVIICELINVDFSRLFKDKIYVYLKKRNYLLYCKLLQNAFFFHKSFAKKLFK